MEREIADLKKWLEDQKNQHNEWAQRIWAFGPNIVAALVTIILTPFISAAVAYFVYRQ